MNSPTRRGIEQLVVDDDVNDEGLHWRDSWTEVDFDESEEVR